MDDDLLPAEDAAALLNVSREFLVELVRSGHLRATRRDGQDFITRGEVLSRRRERDDDRRRKLDELVEMSEGAGGYTEIE